MKAIQLAGLIVLASVACSDDSNDPGGGPEPEPVVYDNDFEAGAGSGWSTADVATAPGGEKYLGDFENEAVALSLSGLHEHTQVIIELDFYALMTWDGNGVASPGPDVVTLSLDGVPLKVTTFLTGGTVDDRQAFPDDYPGGEHPAFTGAAATSSLGFAVDATFHITFTVPHSAATLEFEVEASGLQGVPDEFWGLDNVKVTLE